MERDREPDTPLGVADRLELLELYARLAEAIDSGDAAGWASLFTEDGSLRTSRGLEVRGRPALARFAAEWFDSTAGRSRHASWHHRFEGAGVDAEGTCRAAVLRGGDAGIGIDLSAIYRDRFRWEPGGWRLRSREVVADPE